MTAKPKGFVKLDRDLLYSEPFAELSSNGTRLLIAIMAGYNGHNNGSVRYGVAQAARWLHCGKSTAVRTFAELRAAGLIEPTERGSFIDKSRAQKGMATAWRFPFLKPNRPPRKIHSTGPVVDPHGS